ncbi:MAG: hypothetical protein IJS46_03355 [Kiritimatiellae bacterium]|nr:hypothetical protein [Kiritimatiellia bacterium]
MQVTPEQADEIRKWASEGASLSDIQTRLADDFGIRLSYLDTRFLLIDLKIDLAENPEKKPVAADPLAAAAGGNTGAPEDYPEEPEYPAASEYPDEPEGAGAPESAPEGAGAGSVAVDVDRIQRPGFAASGSITCSDGVKGQWGIDNYGRIALAFPGNKGYNPSAADQQAFMMQLRSLLGGY